LNRAKGDYDRAIGDYDAAIRLDPNDATLYRSRGSLNGFNGDEDRAIADYNEAIRLDPNDATFYAGRGSLNRAKGDYDHAIADYDAAIRLDAKYAGAYFSRGVSYLYSGNLAKALADVTQASAVEPKNAYTAIWLDIVAQRNNLPSPLAQASAQVDMTVWPAPVIRMFMGQMTPAAVLAAADAPDPNKKRGQVCEADFFSGELALRMGVQDDATRLFRLAASDCPKLYDEPIAAIAELKALGAGP
jgi:lipoprotein NlpI